MKMHWNVTYNDPNRWNEVYAICVTRWSWRQGIRQAWSGQPLGSPKLDLLQVLGINELQAMRDELNHRTPINFLRTTKGVIAFTKVRLEVYAIPIEESELQRLEVMENQEGRGTSTLALEFLREAQSVQFVMQGPSAAVGRMEAWLSSGLSPRSQS